MINNLSLNKDQEVLGTVVTSRVANPIGVGSEVVYSIEIKPHNPGLCDSLGLLFHDFMGPNALNGTEVAQNLMDSETLVFESIREPLTTGAEGANGEFEKGQQVRVSCRFELSEPVMSTVDPNGCFIHPRLILRFVDADLEPETNGAEPIVSTASTEQLSYYDF